MTDLIYTLPLSLGKVIFTTSVLEKMSANRQIKFWSKEAGGQLFAFFEGDTIKIVESTGPKKIDKRGRFSFWPHRQTEQAEIHKKYVEDNLHFVGDWHTHPEDIACPSQNDIQSVEKIMKESKHNLPGILLVIVGRSDLPGCLYVGFQMDNELHELSLKI